MAAFDLIGEDLELGLGVDGGARAQKQIAIELMRIGLVGARPDADPAQENSVRAILEHALEDFAGRAARRRVVDDGRDGGFLICAEEVSAVDATRGTLASDRNLHILAREPRASGEREAFIARTALQSYTRDAEMDCVPRLILNPRMIERGIGIEIDPQHAVGPAGSAAAKRLDQLGLASGASNDGAAGVQRLPCGTADMNNFNRIIQHRTGRKRQDKTVTEECAIERGKGLCRGSVALVEPRFSKILALGESVRGRAKPNALRQ